MFIVQMCKKYLNGSCWDADCVPRLARVWPTFMVRILSIVISRVIMSFWIALVMSRLVSLLSGLDLAQTN